MTDFAVTQLRQVMPPQTPISPLRLVVFRGMFNRILKLVGTKTGGIRRFVLQFLGDSFSCKPIVLIIIVNILFKDLEL